MITTVNHWPSLCDRPEVQFRIPGGGTNTSLLELIYLSRKTGAARWASMEGKWFAQGHTVGRQQFWHSKHMSHPREVMPWSSRMLQVFIPMKCPATYSSTLPAESSPGVSPLSTTFQPCLRLLPYPPQTPQLCSRYMPGLECLSCPEVEMHTGLGAGTTQYPQMPHFTTTMLHSSVVGHIWLAVSNVLTVLFKSQEKLQCPG